MACTCVCCHPKRFDTSVCRWWGWHLKPLANTGGQFCLGQGAFASKIRCTPCLCLFRRNWRNEHVQKVETIFYHFFNLWRSLGSTWLPGVPNRSLMTVLVCDECGLIGNSILPFRSFHLEPRQASLGSDHNHPCATPGIDFVHPTPQMVQRSSTATVVVWGKLHGFPGWNTSNYPYRSSISPKTLVVACSCLFFLGSLWGSIVSIVLEWKGRLVRVAAFKL